MESSRQDMKRLFEPASIAIVGASANPDKIGYKVVENILAGGYRGRVLPVNPKGGTILGVEARASIADLETDVDAAVIVVPAPAVFEAVKALSERRARNLIVITSGFSEVGNSEEEHRVVGFAREHGMRVLGPNIFGVYSAKGRLNATFGPKTIMPGGVAIITQSGAIGVAMIGKTAAENIGLSAIVSVGNKADIDEADLIEHLVEDDGTRIILMYIEGVKNGERFVRVLKNASLKKPILVVKSGRSKRGAVAVASHTGSLAGADAIFDSIMRQCGVIRTESIQEAFDSAKFLSESAPPKGPSAVIITNGGGIGVLATDACEKYGVSLYDDPERLKEAFAAVVPEFGSVKNPVDLTGQASAKDYAAAIETAAARDEFHAAIALYCETAMLNLDELEKVITEKYERFRGRKPIVFTLFGGEKTEACASRLSRKGIPIFTEVYDAIAALGALYRGYYYRLSHGREENLLGQGDTGLGDIDVQAIQGVIDKALREGRSFLLAPEAQAVMKAAGVPMPPSRLAKSLKEAVLAAEGIGYPVVMKVVSKDILHKSDAGGVAIDLDNRIEVADAYEAILHNCMRYNKNARIDGIEVCQMVAKGTEIIIGGRRDQGFGPILMFGLGGIYVEVMKDVSFRSIPIDEREAREMVQEIKSYPLLMGVRGEKKKDVTAILEVMLRVGDLLRRVESITDIEVNPLVVYEKGEGCLAVDARILVQSPRR